MEYIIIGSLEQFLYILTFTCNILLGIVYISKGNKSEIKEEKLILIGFGLFFICIGLSNMFYFDIKLVSFLFFSLAYILVLLNIERVIKRTKFLLSIGFTALSIGIMLESINIIKDFNFIQFAAMYMFISVTIIIFWFLKNSEEDFKNVSAFLLLGTYVFFIGDLFRSIPELHSHFPWLTPILFIFGSLLFITPLIFSAQIFSNHPKWLWFIIIIYMGIWLIFLDLSIMDLTILEYIWYIVYNIAFIGIILYSIVRIRAISKYDGIMQKSGDSLKTNESKKRDFLKMFVKPERLTEEEVTISKEKKICLVCKNIIGGINFLCFECGAFYCEKCFRALSELENACWACDYALDATKPVKLAKQDEEKPSIEAESQKKGGKKSHM